VKAYKYSWTRRYGVDPQVAGEIIQRAGSADAVLVAAADPACPLHSLFEWDDSVAAVRYRLIQAREMIGSLRVEIVQPDKRVEHVAAFVNKVDKTGYVPVLEATSEQLTAAEKRFWAEASRFKAKWKGLQLARSIIEAINDTGQSVARRAKRG